MIPGQRVSRRSQALENYAMGVGDVANDNFDDFGMPTKSKVPNSTKKSGLFNRFKRGASKGMDANDSDDEEGNFDVIPGFSSPAASMPHLPNMANGAAHPQFTPNQTSSSNSLYTPNRGAFPPSSAVSYRGSGASDAGSVHNLAHVEDDISFDQISSLRDRHRYPAMSDDNKGRTMSLTSMSNYDTRPIIPLMSHPTNSKGTGQPDTYRHRMVETRRALLGPDQGLMGAPSPALPPQSADRKMSMTSVRSNASRQNGYKVQNMGPPTMGYGANMGHNIMHNGMHHNGFSAGIDRSQMQHSGPYSTSMGPPSGVQSPYTSGPPNHAPRGPMGPSQHPHVGQNNQSRYNGFDGAPQNANFFGPGDARSLKISNPAVVNGTYSVPSYSLDQTENSAVHSAEDFGLQPLGPQSPATHGMQPTDFDFESNHTPNVSTDGVKPRQDSSTGPKIDSPTKASGNASNLAHISILENEVRVLSIELAESARRELRLNPGNEHINLVAALATAHSELSLERKKRESLERILYNNGIVDSRLPQRLADLEYHHSEAVHLLAIRSQQYEKIATEQSELQSALDEKSAELSEVLSRTRTIEQHQHIFDHNKRLTQQVETLEHENEKLKADLERESGKESSNDRVTALEEQRSALQDAMRAMRQRKDAEIHHLNARIEALSLNQQRSRAASSSARLNDDISPRKTSTFASGSPVKSMSSDDDGSLVMPRLRDPGIRRPASPLHIGLDYSR